MLRMPVLIVGHPDDVALCLRLEQGVSNDGGRFCGISYCIGGRWLGDINTNHPIGLVVRALSDVIGKENSLGGSHIDARAPRLFPDTIYQAIVGFLGDGIFSGGEFVGRTELGDRHCIALDLADSLQRVFAVTSDDSIRIYVVCSDDLSKSFIHETRRSDFFNVLRVG